jgi:UDP-2,3-diacylglucosamine pyrophosphatase LpxH
MEHSYTVVVSDIHLADIEPPHSHGPLWKKYKNPEFFIDGAFLDFLRHVQSEAKQPIELILNGDIFDFDTVMTLPTTPIFPIGWLERHRGLNPEEAKSHFKISTILDTHPVWIGALKEFIANGNKVIFVIGNHDIELHWPKVQAEIRSRAEDTKSPSLITFADWFYVSNQDTLIEHSNQYDPYSMCMNPMKPFIKKHNEVTLRIPFGNLAGKYMVNGMGMMNPHSENSYIKGSIWGYMVFFYDHILKVQPLILYTWFWGACATLWVTVSEGLHPSLKNPLGISKRIEEIAERAQATPEEVLSLSELHAHPACYNPIQLLRELWLDRALLLALGTLLCFEVFLFFNLFTHATVWFFIVPFVLFFPAFIFYARSIRSGVAASMQEAFRKLPLAAKITKVKRVIHGHTHRAMHTHTENIEYLNPGTWSPAFRDVECTQAYGRKCFVIIRASEVGRPRVAELFEWCPGRPPLKVEPSSK